MASLRKMSANGDDKIAEWDPQTVSPEQLHKIEAEYNALAAKGYFVADITDGRNVLVKDFDPNADLLMIPRVQGG